MLGRLTHRMILHMDIGAIAGPGWTVCSTGTDIPQVIYWVYEFFGRMLVQGWPYEHDSVHVVAERVPHYPGFFNTGCPVTVAMSEGPTDSWEIVVEDFRDNDVWLFTLNEASSTSIHSDPATAFSCLHLRIPSPRLWISAITCRTRFRLSFLYPDRNLPGSIP